MYIQSHSFKLTMASFTHINKKHGLTDMQTDCTTVVFCKSQNMSDNILHLCTRVDLSIEGKYT